MPTTYYPRPWPEFGTGAPGGSPCHRESVQTPHGIGPGLLALRKPLHHHATLTRMKNREGNKTLLSGIHVGDWTPERRVNALWRVRTLTVWPNTYSKAVLFLYKTAPESSVPEGSFATLTGCLPESSLIWFGVKRSISLTFTWQMKRILVARVQSSVVGTDRSRRGTSSQTGDRNGPWAWGAEGEPQGHLPLQYLPCFNLQASLRPSEVRLLIGHLGKVKAWGNAHLLFGRNDVHSRLWKGSPGWWLDNTS